MSATEAATLKSKVKALANTTQTITSSFVQYKHLDFLENDIETSGNLAFKSPDVVKWEYVKPFKYSVLFKNEKLYINDEGKKSDVNVGKSKMFKQLNHLIIGSIKGDLFNADEFNMEFFKEGENNIVYFSPKDKKLAKFIQTFHITFNTKGDVIMVKMIEPSQDYTKIVFLNKVLNQPINETVFKH
ncbi:MAG: outer membrane lipoprotein carrier protein LolA [Oceanihabitans sp.]